MADSSAAVAEGSEAGAPPMRLAPLQWLVLSLILILYIVDGIDMQILGVSVSAISDDWQLPLSAFGTAMAAGHAGSGVGAVFGGLLGDKFGRRPIIIAGPLVFGIFTLCILFATTPTHLVVLRFLAGLGLGGCLPPALALLAECMPPRLRSFSVSLAILCAPVGIAIAGFLASALLPLHGWQTLFVVAGLMPFLVCALLWLMLPESPAFMLRTESRRAEAERLLERLELANIVDDPAKLRQPAKSGFSALFKHGVAISSLCLFGMFFLCFLSMSMVLSWLPALLSNVGFGAGVAGTALATWSLTGMGGVLLAGVLMTKFGTSRIVGVFIGGSILVLSVVAIALPMPGDSTALLLFYVLIAAGGFMLNGTMTTIYAHAADVFTSAVRATGIGASATSGRMGAISGAFIGVYMLELTGANGFFGVVAAALLLAFLLYLIGLAASARADESPQIKGN